MFETKDFFPTPQTIEVPIETLATELEGFKILHLSDIHIGKNTPLKRVDKLISLANSLNPDIVVITGDILDAKPKEIEDKLMLFKLLKTDTYFISGNHDLYHGIDELVDSISDWNIHFIDNKIIKVKHNGFEFHMAGISDRFSKFFKKDRDEKMLIDKAKELKPLIFLAHQPKDYSIAEKCGSSLFLAGHTHGGQVFPFHFLVKLAQPFLNGLQIKDKMSIYISRGFGHWGVNFRFLAPSEITLLKLKRA